MKAVEAFQCGISVTSEAARTKTCEDPLVVAGVAAATSGVKFVDFALAVTNQALEISAFCAAHDGIGFLQKRDKLVTDLAIVPATALEQFLKLNNIAEPPGLVKDASVDLVPANRQNNIKKIIAQLDETGKDSLKAASYLNDPAKFVANKVLVMFIPVEQPDAEQPDVDELDDGTKSPLRVSAIGWVSELRNKEAAAEMISMPAVFMSTTVPVPVPVRVLASGPVRATFPAAVRITVPVSFVLY